MINPNAIKTISFLFFITDTIFYTTIPCIYYLLYHIILVFIFQQWINDILSN